MKVLNNDSEDLKLVNKIKSKNCNDSFIHLSSSYENFYFSIAKKYTPALLKTGMNRDDIKSELYYVLYKAISSFDPNQNSKFSTWFCNCSRYHFLNYINANKKYVASEEKTIDFFNNKDVLLVTDKSSDMLDYLTALLSSFKDKRINDVYKLRYFSNNEKLTTWNKIAKKLGMSTQTAINLHEKARVFLKNKIQSKNSFDLI